eukprot:209686_1
MASSVFISTVLGIVYGVITVIVIIYSYHIIAFLRRYLCGKKTEIGTTRFTAEPHSTTTKLYHGPNITETTYKFHVHYSFCDYGTKEYIVKILRKYYESDCVLPINVETVCLQYIGLPFYYGPFKIKQKVTQSIYKKHKTGNYPSYINIRYDSKYPSNCNIIENESLFLYIMYGFGYMLLLAAFLWLCILLDSPLTVSENDIVATCMIFILMVFITSITIICSCIKYKHPCVDCFNGWFDRYYLNKNLVNLLFQIQCDEYSSSNSEDISLSLFVNYDESDRWRHRETVQSLQFV